MAESMWQGCGCGGAGARSRGFTLMELLITVGILAILAAIAIPSYSAYVVRGQRASAKVVLLQTAQSLERYYTANGAYLTNAGALPLAPVGGTATCLALAPVDASLWEAEPARRSHTDPRVSQSEGSTVGKFIG